MTSGPMVVEGYDIGSELRSSITNAIAIRSNIGITEYALSLTLTEA
jgi:hypothetical protein